MSSLDLLRENQIPPAGAAVLSNALAHTPKLESLALDSNGMARGRHRRRPGDASEARADLSLRLKLARAPALTALNLGEG